MAPASSEKRKRTRWPVASTWHRAGSEDVEGAGGRQGLAMWRGNDAHLAALLRGLHASDLDGVAVRRHVGQHDARLRVTASTHTQ